jgi:hypothetical protein
MKRKLKCSRCGELAGFWKQSEGLESAWGICAACRDFFLEHGYSSQEFERTYGVAGIHYDDGPADPAKQSEWCLSGILVMDIPHEDPSVSTSDAKDRTRAPT